MSAIFLIINTGLVSIIHTSNHESSSTSNLVFQKAFGQELILTSNHTLEYTDIGIKHVNTDQNQGNLIVKAFGHFANNQLKDGIVLWIQGGFWNLEIHDSTDKKTHNFTTPRMIADFNANFTMVKPNGSLYHNHNIENFISNNVIFAGKDIIITGNADIISDEEHEYKHVPITIHLMGKKVLGLMIDFEKTKGHFSGTNEMYGTLISGLGLEDSNEHTVYNISSIRSDSSLVNNTISHAIH